MDRVSEHRWGGSAKHKSLDTSRTDNPLFEQIFIVNIEAVDKM